MTDDELLSGFEACTLAEFHHADHVRVVWIILHRFTTSLQRFAAANGAAQKYDDALTCRYLGLIAGRMRGERTWEEFAAANPDLLVWMPASAGTSAGTSAG